MPAPCLGIFACDFSPNRARPAIRSTTHTKEIRMMEKIVRSYSLLPLHPSSSRWEPSVLVSAFSVVDKVTPRDHNLGGHTFPFHTHSYSLPPHRDDSRTCTTRPSVVPSSTWGPVSSAEKLLNREASSAAKIRPRSAPQIPFVSGSFRLVSSSASLRT